MTYRVAITGLGLVTPIGTGIETVWRNLLDGMVAVDVLDRFDAATFPSRIAAQINDFDPAAFLSRRRVQWTDRFSQFAVAAARLAVEDAKFDAENRDDVGVYTGSALGGLAFAEEQIAVFHQQGLRAVRPLLSISVFGGAAASNVAIEFGITGPTIANADSCASGAIAVGDAFRAVARGDVRAAIAGGVEAPLAPLTFGAFTVARAMSTRNDDPKHASRPFDRDRDGFVMAEGGGFVILERYDDAIARDARIYATIEGYGTSNDAHHMSAPRPDGSQTAAALQRAIDDARIEASEIDAINAHGSSTPLGDRAELLAYRTVFGDRLAAIPITATKGQHGHALGATGAWEVAIAAKSLVERTIPGTMNFVAAENGIVPSVTAEAREYGCEYVLSNSSGFGGINAAVILKRT
ncbi:MAG: beta-ketoacyl-[acyl-carrier-protein] synthase family protein [Candidatus Eremiobacteraeota bacterium]|nr:beta-ketoacyl-[acyl-carrier-protein] synthase family protein [Candidatus Eremiobacteraeota bacterium]